MLETSNVDGPKTFVEISMMLNHAILFSGVLDT